MAKTVIRAFGDYSGMTKSEKFATAVWWRKPIIKDDPREKRWLDDGSIITLSENKRTSSNVEFMVNDDPKHLVWYSQLSKVFLQLELLETCSGAITFKNGEKKLVNEYAAWDFIDVVKGKKFRVSVNPDGDVAVPSDKQYRGTWGELTNLVKKHLDNDDIDAAADLLKPDTEYELTEV